jgi:hypothetical protein
LNGSVLAPLIAAVTLAGCTASAPASKDAGPGRVAMAPVVSPVTSTAEKLALVQAWARNAGYKPYSQEGKPVWCKNEALLGSHLGRVRCVKEEALADLQRQSIESQQTLSERERLCSGGDCNKTR